MRLSRVFPKACLPAALAVLSVASALEAGTLVVRAGENLQAALNAAQPGDTILLEAGATFSGNFTLPVKSGAAYITLRSSADDSRLPAADVRISPAFSPMLPKIQSPNTAAALRALPGAHHWRLLFLEFPSTQLGYGEIIRIGDGSSAQSLLSQVPYEIEIDRVYVHGHPLYGQKRGIALNGRSVVIRNSYVSDIKAVGVDTQAIGGWNGPGPFTIENNYLEASGENFLLGGSDPAIPGLVSEDVVVRYNYMSRPMSWRDPVVPTPASVSATAAPDSGGLAAGAYAYSVVARRPVGGGMTGRSTASPAVAATLSSGGSIQVSWVTVSDATEYRVYGRGQYWTVTGTSFTDSGAAGSAGAPPTTAGETWQVKNVFELKNARRVVVEYNVFENNWQNAQNGYAVLFTPRNQSGACPWCVVEDVTFQHNIVRNSAAGINLSGHDYPNTSAQTNRVRIVHNLFYGITTGLGGSGWFLLVGDEPREITVDHNTVDADGTTVMFAHGGTAAAPRRILGFQFTNNAMRHNQYGLNGASFAYGNALLAGYFPEAWVQGNWLQGGSASKYPAGNIFSGAFADAFSNPSARDYRPAVGSVLLTGSTDGSPIGADVGALLAALPTIIDGTTAVVRPKTPTGLKMTR